MQLCIAETKAGTKSLNLEESGGGGRVAGRGIVDLKDKEEFQKKKKLNTPKLTQKKT